MDFRPISVEEVENMSFEAIMARFGVTDEQAFDSEEGGDSDADDCYVKEEPPRPPEPKRRRSQQSGESSLNLTDEVPMIIDVAEPQPLSSQLSPFSPGAEDGSVQLFPELGNLNQEEDPFIIFDQAEPRHTASSSLPEGSSGTHTNAEQEWEDIKEGEDVDDDDDDDDINDQPIPSNRIAMAMEDESSSQSSEESENDDYNAPPVFVKGPGKNSILGNFTKGKFNQPSGPKVPVNVSSFLSIFFIFFTEDLIDLIVQQSNLYAAQRQCKLNLTREEFLQLLGIIIIMGFHRLPSMRHYWSSNNNFRMERVANVMSLRRFLSILRNIHINDNTKAPKRDSPNFDKLYKIRPYLNHFSTVFGQVFSPKRFLSVDESMIAFKGRSSLKQYMPMKPIKRGFKIWALCCSTTGFMLAFDFYTGKDVNATRADSLGERVVLLLTAAFQGMGYCIFFDRFFSSFSLLQKLLKKGCFAVCTILQTKKYFPRSLLAPDKELKYGERDFCYTKNVGLVKWRDRGAKCVTVASTMDDPESEVKILRRNKKGEKVLTNCPASIETYNKHMGGVDLFDQYMSYYSTEWKSMRWWMKAFYYFVDASVVNAYILYKEQLKIMDNKRKPKSHLIFRSELADQLIGSHRSGNRICKKVIITKKKHSSNPVKAVPEPQGHYPIRCGPRRCAYCSTRKIPKRSSIMCDECDVGLCTEPCFKLFHVKMSET